MIFVLWVLFGLILCFCSALSFPPCYYDGECNVFADHNWSIGRLKKLILTNDEVSELCRSFLLSCLIYESRGLRPHVVWGPFQIWEPGFERYSGYPSICPNFLPVRWILVQDNGPHLMDIETKVEVIRNEHLKLQMNSAVSLAFSQRSFFFFFFLVTRVMDKRPHWSKNLPFNSSYKPQIRCSGSCLRVLSSPAQRPASWFPAVSWVATGWADCFPEVTKEGEWRKRSLPADAVSQTAHVRTD